MYKLIPVNITTNYWIFELCYQSNTIGRARLFIDAFNCLHLQFFRLHNSYQRQGHGRKCYELIETYVRTQTSFRKICIQSTHQAHGFWIKMGFKNIISFDDILLEMEKILPT
jgi:GNAT superfamily N-acetyltransferase